LTQNPVCGGNRQGDGDFASQKFAFDCHSSSLVVVEQNAFLAELLPEHLIFGPQVVDYRLLLPIDSASQDLEIELPGMQGEFHQCSRC
jgi:hypothetical protein